jgi:hypothetical protein
MLFRKSKFLNSCVGAVLAAGVISPAFAQDDQAPPPNDGNGPPQGQYAEAPPDATQGNAAYGDQAQDADRAYADAYARWAARYCVDEHNNNVAAGAVIGGILGAAIGAGIAHSPATGAAIGGAVGIGAGAAAGASESAPGCPPGYVVASSAPVFAYSGPYYDPYAFWAPAWYHPWVWTGGHWIYHPYRYWYWGHRAYWHPGWRARPWRYRYHW